MKSVHNSEKLIPDSLVRADTPFVPKSANVRSEELLLSEESPHWINLPSPVSANVFCGH